MKIALVTNILTPYRKRFYDELSKQLQEANGELKVYVMTNDLPLRPWNYEALKAPYTELMSGKKIFIKGQDILFNSSVNCRMELFSPDVVILAGSWTYPTSWKMMLNKLKSKPRYYFWTESHNVRGTKIASKNLFIEVLKKKFYKLFDGYCIPGKYAEETVNELVGDFGERFYLPNLVDDTYYEQANILRANKKTIREKYNLPLEKKLFVTPARLIAIKGMDLFLRQIQDCASAKDATFVLAGEGPLEETIQTIVKENDLDVRLMGYCNQEQVRDFYAAADFFLLPSLLDPNPLTVIEASFSGLPLAVSYYVGNSPELVRNLENGIVYDTKNKQSVVEGFEFLMSASEEWIEKAGKESLEIATNNFKCIAETSKLIKYFVDKL